MREARNINSGMIKFSTPTSPKVSIALAAYNGEQFLSEQLASINAQTHPPDELVVVDDDSTDSTGSIVDAFTRSSCIQTRYLKNATRLGYVKNFERAVDQCKGDIILLCDQDDVWQPHKIERVLKTFAQNPSKHVVINDARLVSATLEDSGLTKLGQIKNSNQSLNQFVTGCCTAITAEFKALFLPVPDDVFVHDTWLHALANSLEIRAVLEESLQLYRRHGSNASSSNYSRLTPLRPQAVYREMLGKSSLEYTKRRKQKTHHLITRLHSAQASQSSIKGIPNALHNLTTTERAVRARLKILQRPRLLRPVPVLRLGLSGGYKVFSGWRSGVKDLFFT